jgi:hypothetical protein
MENLLALRFACKRVVMITDNNTDAMPDHFVVALRAARSLLSSSWVEEFEIHETRAADTCCFSVTRVRLPGLPWQHHPIVSLETRGISEASPSDSVARQPLNHTPCFAAFYCFLQICPFPCLLWSSSPCDFLLIPIQFLFFNIFIPLPQCVSDPLPVSHFIL